MSALEPLECLELDPEAPDCQGDVELRCPLSGTGQSFPRCERHWEARLDRQAEIDAAYPDSPIAPDWFDPTAIGERWNDDY